MSLRSCVFFAASLLFAAACAGQRPAELAPAPPPASPVLPPAVIQTESSVQGPTTETAPAEVLPSTPALRYVEGLAVPESVLYDEMADRYLVSNINGSPLGVDNNGYVLELSPEGKLAPKQFIVGGRAGVKLDAPKGMTISKGVLYVSDVTFVRKFDAKTGAPKGEIAVPGAAFLNDIAVTSDGRVFVTDSGLKMGDTGLEPMGADAVYLIEKDKVRTLAKSSELGGPNGILVLDQAVLVVSFGKNELYRLDAKGARQDITLLPQGGLDGLLSVGDTLLISSWAGSAVYRGKLGGKFEPIITGVKSPADIGFDTKRQRLLVPRFLENVVEAYDLK